jgi:Trk-type K+ transport system membrane component
VLLLIVWIAVVVVAVLALGIVGYLVLGAAGRLRRELDGAERDVRPLLDQLAATSAAVERRARERADDER